MSPSDPPSSAKRPSRPSRLLRATGPLLVVVGLPLIGALGFGLVHPVLPVGPEARPSPGEWVGVLHVHTRASDGTGTVPEVVTAARGEGLDFVVVTDHNGFAEPASSYRDGVLVLIGEEATTDRGEHLLVIGGDDPALREGEWLAVPDGPDDALRIVAHPLGPGRPWERGIPGSVDAMEIWNADTELRSGDGVGDWLSALALLVTQPVGALYRLLDHPGESLALFDSLAAQRPLAAACGVDAHQRIPLGSVDIRFPRYRHSFRFARVHVLVDAAEVAGATEAAGATELAGTTGATDPRDAARDGRAVLEALRRGRSWCAFDGLADGRGLVFEVDGGSGDPGLLGDEMAWREGLALRVELPPAGEEARIRVVRDGRVMVEKVGRSLRAPLSAPGLYRLEAALDLPRDGRGWLPWILTGHLRVTGAENEARAAREDPPVGS